MVLYKFKAKLIYEKKGYDFYLFIDQTFKHSDIIQRKKKILKYGKNVAGSKINLLFVPLVYDKNSFVP